MRAPAGVDAVAATLPASSASRIAELAVLELDEDVKAGASGEDVLANELTEDAVTALLRDDKDDYGNDEDDDDAEVGPGTDVDGVCNDDGGGASDAVLSSLR